MKSRLWTAAFLLAALPAAARDFADTFERDADGDGLPDGWVAAPDPAAPRGGTMARGDGREGRGLVLEAGASTTYAAETRIVGRLDLAHDYVLSGWVRVEGPEGASAWLTVQYVDDRGDPLGAAQATEPWKAGEWKRLSLAVSLIDSRTRSIAIRCVLSNGGVDGARARFDDVSWVALAFVDGFEADIDKDGFPDRWRSLKGDEFPAFNAVETRIAGEDSRSGARCALLKTSGRHSGLETRWAIAIDADRAYELRAWVRTDGLEDAAAWVELEWLDERESALGTLRSPGVRGDSPWKEVAIAAPVVPPRARFARLRLIVGGSDTAGQAWFDDVEWLGRVQVRLDTESRPGNIFREAEAAEAGGITGSIIALGLDAAEYEVLATVVDSRGKTAWDGRVGSRDLNVRANLALPFRFEKVLLPGSYAVEIRLRSSGQPDVVAAESFGIVHEPVFPRAGSGDYGAWWNPWAGGQRRPGAVLGLAWLGRVRVPLWDASAADAPGLDPAGAEMHERLLDFRRNNLDVVAVLATGPGRQGGTRLFEGFAARDGAWEEAFAALAAAHRDVVVSWQLGDADLSLARSGDASLIDRLAARLAAAHDAGLLGLAVPPGSAPAGLDAAVFLALDLDAADREGLHPSLAAETRELFFTAAPDDPALLVRRLVAARARGIRRADIGGDGSALLTRVGTPTRTWYAIRVLNDLLAGSEPVSGALLPGLPAFRKDGRLVIACFADHDTSVDAWLGAHVVSVDLLGRHENVPADASGRRRVPLGPEPYFLVLSDASFAETQLSVTLEGTPLRSRTGTQILTLLVTNRFKEPIVNVRIVDSTLPARWRPAAPPPEIGRLEPGQTARFPLEVALPADARPGNYELRARLTFSSGEGRREAILVRSLAVAPEIEVRPRIEATADGKGIEITVTLRNRGAKKADFKVYVNRGPGARTLDDVVYGLEPGAEKIVRFLAEADTKGTEYLVGLRGIADDLFVNEVVTVP